MTIKLRLGGLYRLANGQVRMAKRQYPPELYGGCCFELTSPNGRGSGTYDESGMLQGFSWSAPPDDGYYVVKEIEP